MTTATMTATGPAFGFTVHYTNARGEPAKKVVTEADETKAIRKFKRNTRTRQQIVQVERSACSCGSGLKPVEIDGAWMCDQCV